MRHTSSTDIFPLRSDAAMPTVERKKPALGYVDFLMEMGNWVMNCLGLSREAKCRAAYSRSSELALCLPRPLTEGCVALKLTRARRCRISISDRYRCRFTRTTTEQQTPFFFGIVPWGANRHPDNVVDYTAKTFSRHCCITMFRAAFLDVSRKSASLRQMDFAQNARPLMQFHHAASGHDASAIGRMGARFADVLSVDRVRGVGGVPPNIPLNRFQPCQLAGECDFQSTIFRAPRNLRPNGRF